jgi:hypothetical protein
MSNDLQHPDEGLQFDKATFDAPRGGLSCQACNAAISDRYWQANGNPLCATCHDDIRSTETSVRTGRSFLRAVLRAGAVALACGIGYAAFVGLTDTSLALITIGIGYLVGSALQKVTRGFGTLRYQVLAVVLTYCAACMGYAVPIVKAFRERAAAVQRDAPRGAAPTPAVQPSPSPPAPAPTAPLVTRAAEAPGVGGFVVGIVALLAMCLAAPFFMLSSGFGSVLSLLIVGFGLLEAWRRAAGVQLTITGPHTVPAPTAVPHGFG